ncbi:MAG: DUF305 domain-containing protein [Rhizobiaceae bacterium]|nr:DUF305 domain-containing protein [Rhizobiaceae bacterium]
MNRYLLAAAAGAAMVAAAFAVPATGQESHGSMDHSATESMSVASKGYMEAMKKMDEEMGAMKMSGKPGVDFAMMMIPHHQSAIDMAQAYLASGENDPELTKLSNEIIAAQEKEIAFLKGWLGKNAN